MESTRSSAPTLDVAAWPPILTFRRALAFTGKSRATLNRAIASGTLRLYGRAGGPRGERTLLRVDLERWLAGDVAESSAPEPRRRAFGTKPADTTSAIARIKAAAKGTP